VGWAQEEEKTEERSVSGDEACASTEGAGATRAKDVANALDATMSTNVDASNNLHDSEANANVSPSDIFDNVETACLAQMKFKVSVWTYAEL